MSWRSPVGRVLAAGINWHPGPSLSLTCRAKTGFEKWHVLLHRARMNAVALSDKLTYVQNIRDGIMILTLADQVSLERRRIPRPL